MKGDMAIRAVKPDSALTVDQANALARELAPNLGGPGYWVRIVAREDGRWETIDRYGSHSVRRPFVSREEFASHVRRFLEVAVSEGLREPSV